MRSALDAQFATGSTWAEADLLFHLRRISIGLGDRETALERLHRSRELWTSFGAAARIAEVDGSLAQI